jgi:hypothetical protein
MTFIKQDGDEPKKTKTKKPEAAPTPDRERTGGPSDYGRLYWCVKSELSEDGEIYLFADEVRFTPTGGVLFVSTKDSAEHVRLALSSGQWSAVYAASCWDGSAVAVEHWQGEVAR